MRWHWQRAMPGALWWSPLALFLSLVCCALFWFAHEARLLSLVSPGLIDSCACKFVLLAPNPVLSFILPLTFELTYNSFHLFHSPLPNQGFDANLEFIHIVVPDIFNPFMATKGGLRS
ncbi:hypothetical protein F5Y18DRAFT_372045 [Xylariaceae sp. FL1019]|nr:hypothetical protein F5Y18DRAFT_372045 [Xylariaceae sp. FL1019]